MVDHRAGESKILYKDPVHLLVLPMACLLQTIKAFNKASNLSFFPWFEDSSGRLHVDHLLEHFIEICALDVPVLCHSVHYYDMHCRHLGCRQKHFGVVHPFNLSMTTYYDVHPVQHNFAIQTTFFFENSAA